MSVLNSLLLSPNGPLSREILTKAISATSKEVIEVLTISDDNRRIIRETFQKYMPKTK